MIRVYLPDHSLQGCEIPFYMLWNRSENIDIIKIEYPKQMEIKEIYNVSHGNFRLENNVIYINKVDVDGYLGIKFTSIMKEPLIETNLHIEAHSQGSVVYKETKSLKLFRPEIKVCAIPQNIHINILENQNKIDVSSKIKIKKEGLGTAVLKLECLNNSDIKMYAPSDVDEFRKGFWNDIERKIPKLKEKFPQYSSLLIEFVEIGRNPPILEKEGLERIKNLFSELLKALEDNKEFLKDFANLLLTSYLKNISVVTELESFLIYLRSVYKNEIIFLNAVEVMKVSTEPMKLRAKIYITDLAYNQYKPIELDSITIKANKECEIPAYLIFDFEGGE